MFKRILSCLLIIFILIGCTSCGGESPAEETNDGQNEPIASNKDTANGQNQTTGSNGNSSAQGSDGESTNNNNSTTPTNGIPTKIIYGSEYSAQATKLLGYLKALDSKNTYTTSADTAKDNGSPEILLGLTNRDLSKQVKDALPTYLDYTIAVSGSKIAIFANTAERLEAAIEYFAATLKKDERGALIYSGGDLYTSSYTAYKYTNLKIANVQIKNFSIVIPANATQREQNAATAVQEWIASSTGILLSIVPDTSSPKTNEIIIGKANRTECSVYSTSEGQKIVDSAILKDKKVLLYANTLGSYDDAIKAFSDQISAAGGKLTTLNVIDNTNKFSGKKAIFIGNSFIYWGGCVTFVTNDEYNEPLRYAGGDKGYFNEVCKANGVDMTVYNYTYGAKNLDWIYNNRLKSLSSTFLDDIDYVFISEAGENNSSIVSTVENISALFTKAEQIVYLAHENNFSSNHTNIINALPTFSQKGIKIVAWGKLVMDVYKGNVKVPNATQSYNKNSFVKNSTGTMSSAAAVTRVNFEGDSFHQNPLAGYITAQMCFSAITGASAVGQKYSFCWDKTIAPQYDLQNFVTHQYNNGQTTNFVEIFNSPSDMLGLQTLMDQYMDKYN